MSLPADFIEEMFNVHNYDLVGYLRVQCRFPHDAEDVAQDTWIRVIEGSADYDDSRPFKPYLFGAANNAMASFYRNLKRGKNKDRTWKEDFLAYNRPEYWTYISPHKEKPESSKLTKYAVAVTLRKLTWKQRMRFRKHYWRGYTYQDICDEEGVTNIASSMYDARKKFKKLYAGGSGTRLASKTN